MFHKKLKIIWATEIPQQVFREYIQMIQERVDAFVFDLLILYEKLKVC